MGTEIFLTPYSSRVRLSWLAVPMLNPTLSILFFPQCLFFPVPAISKPPTCIAPPTLQ